MVFQLLFIVLILVAFWSLMRDVFVLTARPSVCPFCQAPLDNTTRNSDSTNRTCSSCHRELPSNRSLFSSKPVSSLSQELQLMVELYAKVTKSDGVVTKQEIQVVDRLIKSHYQPSNEQMIHVRSLFNTSKNTSMGYETLINRLKQVLPNQESLRLRILDDLFQIALADDPLDHRQESLIFYTAEQLHVSSSFKKIRARYIPEILQHYSILESKETDSLDTIKKNYRRLIKEHHPDRYMHQEQSPDFIQLANQKIKDIHQAYDIITKSKKQTSVN